MTESSEGLHALDAVRGFALLAGIVFHASLSFLPGPAPLWIVGDVERSASLGVLFYVLHIFRMTAFFLIAGFFGRTVLHRQGMGGFVRDRLKRIALPLVVFWPILIAGIVSAAWFVAYTLRRRAWLGVVAAGWMVTSITMAFYIGSVTFILLIGLGILLWMAVPGFVMLRLASKAA